MAPPMQQHLTRDQSRSGQLNNAGNRRQNNANSQSTAEVQLRTAVNHNSAISLCGALIFFADIISVEN
jgi:hypothetical protein